MYMGRQITTATPTLDGKHLVGEYVLTGKRGGVLLSVRLPESKTVGFYNPNANHGFGAHGAALAGNYTMPVASIAAHAVTFTDADRV